MNGVCDSAQYMLPLLVLMVFGDVFQVHIQVITRPVVAQT
jgi:hypothetical protein